MTRVIRLVTTLILTSMAFIPAVSKAATYTLPANGNIVGKIQYTTIKGGQRLSDIARQYDVGYYEILEANPSLNPMQLRAGQRLKLPTRFVLPDAPRKGIVINLAELRLYYYPPGRNVVMTDPIGIGRQGWETPTGNLKIIQKRTNPSWRVPPSVWADAAANGTVLPKVMPPGPDNPLGKYAIRLSKPTYLIHSTNAPNGVGRRVSAGCIRMYPEDIERLYPMVNVGTPVNIVNQPYKIGRLGNKLYLEAHRPLFETRKQGQGELQAMLSNAISDASHYYGTKIPLNKARKVAAKQAGVPQVVASVN